MVHKHTPIYEIRKFPGENGETWPYLVNHGLPVLLPNLWVDELRIATRANTVESYLRDILLIYKCEDLKSIDFNTRFKSLQGFSTGELRSISSALCTLKKRIGFASRATCMRRLESARNFFRFAFDHYIQLQKLSLDQQIQAEKNYARQLKKLARYINQFANQSCEAGISTDLGVADIDNILQVVEPHSLTNPFKDLAVRFRNYCIILTALDTFARRSEIVLLELTDISFSATPTITIKHPSSNTKAKRRDNASLKTLGRVIPINHKLAEALLEYVKVHREKLLRPLRPSTSLFLSSRDGRRLSSGTINQILKRIEHHPQIKSMNKRVHPHGLRSTGANRMRGRIENSAETRSIDMEEALSYLGGWCQGSPQVRRYTRTALSERLSRIVHGDGLSGGSQDGES